MHHLDALKPFTDVLGTQNPLDSESDGDVIHEFEVCPFEEELKDFPEILMYIKNLQRYLKKQHHKLGKLRRKLKESRTIKKQSHDVGTQTEDDDNNVWNIAASTQGLAEQVKEAAETAMQQTGFVYEETSGMYYDYNSGYYYNAELGLYYDGNSGTYYYYDEQSGSYQFHSQVELPQPNMEVPLQEQPESKRKAVHKPCNESKKVKSCEHDDDDDDDETESLEDGECSTSSDDEGSRSSLEPEKQYECAKAWPPCMRIIVKETGLEDLKVGALFIVTCTGGTLGREKQHAVCIPDINISKHHAKISFDESLGKYFLIDFGSRNGTYLNGKRLSVAKQESEPHEVVHGSLIQVGNTKLLCHIHCGRETCGHCEPGLVQQQDVPSTEDERLPTKKEHHKKELKRLRRKFGLEKVEQNQEVTKGYEDRAQIRRSTVGSQNPYAKTQTASLEESIQSDNKGFKLLMKMGWTEGQALGKDSDGRVDPVPVISRPGKAGLGCPQVPEEDPATERKKAVWRKTQERYKDLSN